MPGFPLETPKFLLFVYIVPFITPLDADVSGEEKLDKLQGKVKDVGLEYQQYKIILDKKTTVYYNEGKRSFIEWRGYECLIQGKKF